MDKKQPCTETKVRLPAEWEPQSGVQLTWPHEESDWREMLDEVVPCFARIAAEISKRELVLLVCNDVEKVKTELLPETELRNVRFARVDSNDTWARDHGFITVLDDEKPLLYDFCFNGWGMKFAANLDNCISRQLFLHHQVFSPVTRYRNMLHYVLEGGSIESDGQGTILATSECLFSENRNEFMTAEKIESFLKEAFGAKTILWLNNGYLEGDDTDSHVDTLARFCSGDVITYVQCEEEEDDHFYDLKLMEDELKDMAKSNGQPYTLVPLPMADVVMDGEDRLPATYANFLVINDAVLLPTYNSPKDEIAKTQLQKAFPDREVIGIDCLPLIKQHGSLHCVTMQYPAGVLI